MPRALERPMPLRSGEAPLLGGAQPACRPRRWPNRHGRTSVGTQRHSRAKRVKRRASPTSTRPVPACASVSHPGPFRVTLPRACQRPPSRAPSEHRPPARGAGTALCPRAYACAPAAHRVAHTRVPRHALPLPRLPSSFLPPPPRVSPARAGLGTPLRSSLPGAARRPRTACVAASCEPGRKPGRGAARCSPAAHSHEGSARPRPRGRPSARPRTEHRTGCAPRRPPGGGSPGPLSARGVARRAVRRSVRRSGNAPNVLAGMEFPM